MNPYVGHPLQIRGAEEHTLRGGKGEGMRLLEIRNGLGLSLTVSCDRAADISRLSYRGINVGYFSPCGYVAPSYYVKEGNGFLKSFTAGFFTTCGLTTVGTPTQDDGEDCPLHGTIANMPAERCQWEETDKGLTVTATVRDASLFDRQLVLYRRYDISYAENSVTLSDCIVNEGGSTSPIMLLYHCNMGYPILTETSEVVIPHTAIRPRNERAAEGIDEALIMEKPQRGFEEQCYYYDIAGKDGWGSVGIYNPDAGIGTAIRFDQSTLDYFTEWKMMGEKEYVLGLEPGNCSPDGRSVHRARGELKFLEPGKEYKTKLIFSFFDNKDEFGRYFV